MIDLFEDFTTITTGKKEIAKNEYGLAEYITIQDKTYCRLKIDKYHKYRAESELNILMTLQGVPLIPIIYSQRKENEDLWILMESFSKKTEGDFNEKDLVTILRDSALTLRILERARMNFQPIQNDYCFFNSEGRMKYLGILFDEKEPSVISSYFTDENKMKESSVYIFFFPLFL